MRRGYLLVVLIIILADTVVGQDLHIPQTQAVNIWYNPALKTDKVPSAGLGYCSVNYPGIVSYTSKTATIALPLIGRDKDADDVIPFANISAGMNNDKSADGFINVSTAMLAFSYAIPLNDNNLCISAGFQGNYTFNRIGTGVLIHYPEQFDQYGAFGTAIKTDPYQSGYSYHYLTAGAGVSLFQFAQDRQWYIGGSIRHFNHPYTEWNHSVRLQSNYGIQAGYAVNLSEASVIGAYTNLSWQGAEKEHFLGAYYTHAIDDSMSNRISCGIGYRLNDALIPNAGIAKGRHKVDFYYEFNFPGLTYTNYKRRSFLVTYSYIL